MSNVGAVRRIPDEELAEHWFSLKHTVLDKLQSAFRAGGARQEDVAVRLGKHASQISRWLRGRTDMNLRTMHDLARGMNCRLRVELDHMDSLTPVNRRAEAPPPPPITNKARTNSVEMKIPEPA